MAIATLLTVSSCDKYETTWQDAYAELLLNYMTRNFNIDCDQTIGGWFMLYDINQDGVPELIFADSFHFTSYLAIYTFIDGEPIQLDVDFFADYSTPSFAPVNEEPGLIQIFSQSNRFRSVFFYTMNNCSLILKHSADYIWHGIVYEDGDWVENESWLINGLFIDATIFFTRFYEIFGFEWGDAFTHEMWESRIQQHIVSKSTIQEYIFGWQPLIEGR